MWVYHELYTSYAQLATAAVGGLARAGYTVAVATPPSVCPEPFAEEGRAAAQHARCLAELRAVGRRGEGEG
jgi:hypothetical protein